METNGARRLLDILHGHGVRTVAGIPGGNILPLYDALHGSDIVHVLARHEQGAAFIAQGFARATGRLGVCLATSGPGATNLVTGLADAWRDSIPLLAITGQVPREAIGTQAFQEIDIATMAASCTKAVWRIASASELDDIVPLAIHRALSGRPGPVLLDIPKDVLLESCGGSRPISTIPVTAIRASGTDLRAACRLLEAASRPLAYAGGGIRHAAAETALREFCEGRGIPVVNSLQGLGALPSGHSLALGMIGMHGIPSANHALQECDLLVVAGARLDDRATGRLAGFAPLAKILHLDMDASEFGRRRTADATLHGDAKDSLERLHRAAAHRDFPEWMDRIRTLRREHPVPFQPTHDLLRGIAAEVPGRTGFSTDVGQHQMWAAQALPVSNTRQFLTSGGLGTMGFGLPAAIGAAISGAFERVVCLTGDGSILMNIQELATLAELDLPVKVCVFDNGGLGMVRQQQSLFFGDRRSACGFLGSPDLAAVAAGFGIASTTVHERDADNSWKDLLRAPGPAFLVFKLDAEASVWPMVPPGASNSEMILSDAA